MQGQEKTEAAPVYLGVDVGESGFDFCGVDGDCHGVANDRRGIAALARRARARGDARVVVEGEADGKSIQWIDFPLNGGCITICGGRWTGPGSR